MIDDHETGSALTKLPMVEVIQLKALPNFRLSLWFSTGEVGIRDFSVLVSESGPMVEPLRDEACFRRVFVDMGALTWPNGFDIDPIHLHMQMRDAGDLASSIAAE
jgi:Protein of unknown function (DUF2442)